MPLPEVGKMFFSTDSLSVPGPGCNETFDHFSASELFCRSFENHNKLFFCFFLLNPIAKLEKTKKGVIFLYCNHCF